ncbi:MAG: lmo0937 family membrane protein [Planctomycetota bacterium]
MLETIAIVMVVLWILGLITSNTLGGFIHILFVIAVVAILLRVIQGPRLQRP